MLDLMQENIQRNHLEDQVIAVVLDWGVPPPEEVPSQVDVILAADCVYLESAFPRLVQTLASLVGAATTVFFCYKKRRRADARFMKMAGRVFTIEDVLDDPDRDVYRKENISL